MALTWHKSSRSGAGGSGNSGDDCVEVAFGPAETLLRDSKSGDRGAVLRANQAAFDAFLHTLKHTR